MLSQAPTRRPPPSTLELMKTNQINKLGRWPSKTIVSNAVLFYSILEMLWSQNGSEDEYEILTSTVPIHIAAQSSDVRSNKNVRHRASETTAELTSNCHGRAPPVVAQQGKGFPRLFNITVHVWHYISSMSNTRVLVSSD